VSAVKHRDAALDQHRIRAGLHPVKNHHRHERERQRELRDHQRLGLLHMHPRLLLRLKFRKRRRRLPARIFLDEKHPCSVLALDPIRQIHRRDDEPAFARCLQPAKAPDLRARCGCFCIVVFVRHHRFVATRLPGFAKWAHKKIPRRNCDLQQTAVRVRCTTP
jgi:hypothetical protein